MRRLLLFVGLLGLLAAPALADVTVRYKVKDQPNKAIALAVADNGNARFDSGDGAALIVQGGARYFVAADGQGPIVGRLEDGITVMTEFMTALIQMMEAAAASQAAAAPAPAGGLAQMHALAAAPYAVQARGSETVGGRMGTLYAIAPEQAGAQGPSLEVVIAADADLAPVAREMRALVGLLMQPAAAFLGQAPDLLAELDGLLAQGAPIRIGQHFRLGSVSAAPVPAGSFELPGPPLTLEQLRARSPLAALQARAAPADAAAETPPPPGDDQDAAEPQ